MKFLISALAATALTLSVARANVIPSTHLADWKPGVTVGVPGGIPTRTNLINVTTAPYSADNTGATDARAAIQSAIAAAKAGDVVYLPAGTYRLDGALRFTPGNSNITLRGAGVSTIIDCRTSDYAIAVGTSYSFNYPLTGNAINPATLVKGATQLEIQDTSAFAVGQLVLVQMANDPAIPVVSIVGYDLRPEEKQWQGLRRQITRITGKTATSLTVFPGMYGDYTGAPQARVMTSQVHITGVGVEDMLIDCSNGSTTFPVGFNTAYGCWAKNVKVQFQFNYGIYISESLNCEIRECWIDQAKGQGSTSHCGFLVDTASGCLIEDNVIARNFPSMMINHGSSGNVIAYNFCYDSRANGVSGVAINTNHGPHNSFNLYEGNIAPNVQADGYFGGASHDAIFRNWLHGTQPNVTTPGWTVSLNRFTRHYSLVGNIFGTPSAPAEGVSLGNPNMGNSAYTGMGPPWTVSWFQGGGTLSQEGTAVSTTAPAFQPHHVGWFLLVPSTSTYSQIVGYTDSQHVTLQNGRTLSNVSYIVAPGPAGYQELDQDVSRTLVRKGNYNYRDKAVPAGEALGTATIPASLFYTSKPAWFGSLAWPAFDPLNPNPSNDAIPAGYRYMNGSAPTPLPPAPPAPTPGPTPASKQKPIGVRVS